MHEPYRLFGGNGSPYSVKMRALMRYRRLPFIWIMRTPAIRQELVDVKPALIPVLQLPDSGAYMLDSTSQAMALEERHPGVRSVVPDDPAQAFLSYLIEDMADEWITKMMFHYRWRDEQDQNYCSRWIISDSKPGLYSAAFEEAANTIKQRQVGRLALVGSTPENAPVIEAGFMRLIRLLGVALDEEGYLFGSRPSLADFGLFGQLKTLADDPTPMRIMRAVANRLTHWIRRNDDASGVEGNLRAGGAALSDSTLGLLAMAGDTYLPFLQANATAAEAGAEELRLTLCGQDYAQAPFRYQVKCYRRVCGLYADLDADVRARLDPVLQSTGCLTYLA
jgi:glutathione S-transferase